MAYNTPECPSEEYEKEEGTLPHDFTTGKWRVHLIYPESVTVSMVA